MDVDAYLRRIGFAGAVRPDLATLRQLVLHHVCAIPFENLDPFVGRRVSLDPLEVEHKLVHGGRGGWCFEQNLLFGNALRALGFDVTDLAGRVLWGRAPDAITPRTHRLLQVKVEGHEYLADVGFGGQMPSGVLDLHSEASQATPHEPFRLRRIGGAERVLESLIQDEWKLMYRFDLQPQLPIDFEAANFQLAHDPGSHFTQGITVSRVTSLGRRVLRGHPEHGVEMVLHSLHEATRRLAVAGPDQVLALLSDEFELATGSIPGLRERLTRLFEECAARASTPPPRP
jgi:N-hydroxyarylamine O-acetyltransferase